MLLRRSDVNKRLPRFREALASIEDVRRQGGFEGVDPTVLDCVSGMEPVGLDHKRQLVLPSNHDPKNGPPVLMVLPGEVDQQVTLKSTRLAIKTARHLIGLSGLDVKLKSNDMYRQFSVYDGDAWVNHSVVSVRPHSDPNDRYTMLIPRLVFVGHDMPADLLGTSLAHEADHWDFFFNEAPQLQSQPGKRYTRDQLKTIAEKRAYRLTYQMEYNLGTYAGLDPIETLAAHYTDLAPAKAATMYDDLVRRREAAGITRPMTAPLAAMAIEQLFGKPDQLITDDEVTAFQASELL